MSHSHETASQAVVRQVQLWRQRRGYSYRKLAVLSGVSQNTLINALARTTGRERRGVTIDLMVAVARGLGVSVIQLLPYSVDPDAASIELPFTDQAELDEFVEHVQALAERLSMR
jgi:transcriptional regulator with XRE-family HTH domain